VYKRQVIRLKPGRDTPRTKFNPITINSDGTLNIEVPKGRIDWMTLVQAFEESSLNNQKFGLEKVFCPICK